MNKWWSRWVLHASTHIQKTGTVWQFCCPQRPSVLASETLLSNMMGWGENNATYTEHYQTDSPPPCRIYLLIHYISTQLVSKSLAWLTIDRKEIMWVIFNLEYIQKRKTTLKTDFPWEESSTIQFQSISVPAATTLRVVCFLMWLQSLQRYRNCSFGLGSFSLGKECDLYEIYTKNTLMAADLQVTVLTKRSLYFRSSY